MSKRNLNSIYSAPLPLTARPLPPLIPHNPLSWVWYVAEWLFPREEPRIVCHGQLSDDGSSVIVRDVAEMDLLWRMGFFGKGTLSRSDPSWYARTSRRLGIETDLPLTSEEITEMRREQRKQFKAERAAAEQRALEERRRLDRVRAGDQAGPDGDSQTDTVAEPTTSVKPVAREPLSYKPQAQPPSTMRPEDRAIVVDGVLERLEVLQLTPCEAVFLAFAVGSLDVAGHNAVSLFKHFAQKDPRFVINYAAYHHYRSHGWCARSGIKFGSDLILYRRGPPFSHAEFAVIVVDARNDSAREWFWNTSMGRVIGTVRKTMVFCYVTPPDAVDVASITCTGDIKRLLSDFSVRDVVYRRWIPTRNRD